VFGDYSPRYLSLNGHDYSCSRDSIKLFFKAAVDQGLKGYLKAVSEKSITIGFSKNKEPWDSEKLFELLQVSLKENLRLAIPVITEFKALASIEWTARLGEHSRAPFLPGHEYMYSPFIVKQGRIQLQNLDELVVWTYENRLNKNVDLALVKSTYLRFIDFVDKNMASCQVWSALREKT
jgi:hypothetical protein